MDNRISNYRSILVAILAFLATGVGAQEVTDSLKRVMEREIKMSGLYLYGEGVANTSSEAKKVAQTMLISEVNKEMSNHPEWQFAKKLELKDVSATDDLIELPRGNKTRVIVYVKKDNIEATFSDKQPEIKLTEKKAEKKEKKSSSKEAEAEQPKEAIAAPAKPEEKKPAVVQGGDLLSSIVNAPSAQEVNKILSANKRNGKAIYGRIETLVDADNVYILVYKSSGEIVAILDTDKKDLITGKTMTGEAYSGNQRIWFQLF